jgi:hypothetical protein
LPTSETPDSTPAVVWPFLPMLRWVPDAFFMGYLRQSEGLRVRPVMGRL